MASRVRERSAGTGTRARWHWVAHASWHAGRVGPSAGRHACRQASTGSYGLLLTEVSEGVSCGLGGALGSGSGQRVLHAGMQVGRF